MLSSHLDVIIAMHFIQWMNDTKLARVVSAWLLKLGKKGEAMAAIPRHSHCSPVLPVVK